MQKGKIQQFKDLSVRGLETVKKNNAIEERERGREKPN